MQARSMGVWVALLVAGSGLQAAPPPIETRTRISVDIRPLTADLVSERDRLFATLVLDSREPAETTLGLAWPEPGAVSELRIRAVRAPSALESTHTVNLDARLTLPDRTVIHSSRSVSLEDRATVLFEVHRVADRSLTLALELEATRETVVVGPRAPGSQVRFRLEVVRVAEGHQVSLESNYLNTLVGEPVSYSFRLGDVPETDAVSVTLRPTDLHADVAEIDVSVSGRLPVDGELTVISRRERWLASRDATSTLAFESGDPPTGYRFLVTARF